MTVSEVVNQPGQAPAETGSAAPAPVQITEDVIKNHPIYKALLEESITRRQTIAALKQELEAKKPVEAPQQTPASKPEADPVSAQLAALMETVNKLTQRIEVDAKSRVDMTRAALIQQHNIPQPLQSFINGGTEDDVRAQVNALLPFITPGQSNVGAGNVGAALTDEDLIAQMRGILDGQPSVDPYDPAIQKKMGGGPQ